MGGMQALQVSMTTHSPIVLRELRGDQVSVVQPEIFRRAFKCYVDGAERFIISIILVAQGFP